MGDGFRPSLQTLQDLAPMMGKPLSAQKQAELVTAAAKTLVTETDMGLGWGGRTDNMTANEIHLQDPGIVGCPCNMCHGLFDT